jgi:hypothetical protein
MADGLEFDDLGDFDVADLPLHLRLAIPAASRWGSLPGRMLVPQWRRNGSCRRLAALRTGLEKNQGSLDMPEIAISAEKVAFLIEKTRQFDVKEGATDPASGSNAIDDGMIDTLQDDGSDPVAQEIREFVNSLTEDEQIDVIALMRLGRGDAEIEEWNKLRRETSETRTAPAARVLLGEPLVSDYLAEGLSAFGIDWPDAAPE